MSRSDQGQPQSQLGADAVYNRRGFLTLAAVGASAIAMPGLLAACRPSTDTTQQGGAPASTGPQKKGGTLVFAVEALTANSDPGAFATFGNWMIIDCVARGLTHVDYHTPDPKPALAESWEISPDQLTYTFKLRRGVKFHDGNTLTAQDFERSWKRLFDDKDPTRIPTIYAAAELGGANVKSFKALDDATFQVKLVKPDVAFLGRCSNPNSVAISRAAIEKYGKRIGENLVGTGPFKFAGFKENQNATLERFDDYWDGAPFLDKVVFQILPDPSALTSALSSGSVQATNFVPLSNIPNLQANESLQVVPGKPYIDIFVGMNMGKPALADLRVRQAINLALDRQAIIDSAFAGQAELPAYLVSPPELGYAEELKQLSTQNLDRAKALIKEAGAEGREVSFISRSILHWPKIGQVVDQNLQAIGLKPKTEYLDEAALGARVFDPDKHEIFMDQRSAFVADPDNKLTPLLASDSFVNQNLTQNYKDKDAQAKLDRMLEQARGEPDETARAKLYVDIQRFLIEDVMVMAMVANHALPTVAAKNVQGINADALGTYRVFFETTSIG